MINTNDLESLLKSTDLRRVESTIVEKIGCDLYEENLSLLTSFIKEEVEVSELSLDRIENFIKEYPNQIIDFSVLFLNESKPQILSTGIAITYSIYLIYLRDKEEKELLGYLKKEEAQSRINY